MVQGPLRASVAHVGTLVGVFVKKSRQGNYQWSLKARFEHGLKAKHGQVWTSATNATGDLFERDPCRCPFWCVFL